MKSQKNSSLKTCIKCAIILTKINWALYDEKVSHYICRTCRKIQDKKIHNNDPLYGDKQLARTRFRKSAIIFSYGNKCNICYEEEYDKLTIDHIQITNKQISNLYEWLYNNPVYKDGYQVLCYNCYCGKNIEYKDKYALRDKKKIIENYGGQCLECKEDKIEKLIIDHGQLKHYTGSKMYRWIIKNNYPSNLGLQILCYNCNKMLKIKKKLKFSRC